jgi:hypothetical protein
VAAFRQRRVALSPLIIVADSWFSDSKLMRHIRPLGWGARALPG